MRDLTGACPRGGPRRPRRLGSTGALALLLTLLLVLPVGAPAEAAGHRRAHHTTSAAKARAARLRVTRAHAAKVRTERLRKARARAAGAPPENYVMPSSAYFSYPNRSKAESLAIRNRLLLTIKSVWGGPRTSLGSPRTGNGTIRIATWSFDDWGIAKALVAARNRGVSVQIIAAGAANADHDSWRWLRKHLGTQAYVKGVAATRDTASFARVCRGACRGRGGTAHSKYLLFDNVGRHHLRHVVVQTSMNLTDMAYQGQWNHAQVMRSTHVYSDFLAVFRQSRVVRARSVPYHVGHVSKTLTDVFFPHPHAAAADDPVVQMLDKVQCRAVTSGSSPHVVSGLSTIRIIQYAIYGNRGEWIAKKLRYLWNRGCDLKIIYSVASRPVLDTLRNGSGRGSVPMRQSVVTDGWGNIVKYNHSKWMTITGRYAGRSGRYLTFSGSANWSPLAFADDEQMQLMFSKAQTLRYLAAFAKTWKQQSSQPPSPSSPVFGRIATDLRLDEPEDAPDWGHGVFRYMSED